MNFFTSRDRMSFITCLVSILYCIYGRTLHTCTCDSTEATAAVLLLLVLLLLLLYFAVLVTPYL